MTLPNLYYFFLGSYGHTGRTGKPQKRDETPAEDKVTLLALNCIKNCISVAEEAIVVLHHK